MMARSRNIKPGFFQNEDLQELDFATRLFFIGLWTEADKEGRLEDRPKKLKNALFPADDVEVEQMLEGLAAYGFISRYERAGKKIIQIVKWAKHQNPHRREAPSTLPAETDEVVEEEQQAESGPQKADTEASPQLATVTQIDRIPYEQIRTLYNQVLGGKLKRCMGVTDTHRKHIRAAYNLKLDDKFVVRDGGLAFWEGLFNDVLDCPFMLGVNGRGWKADFEFLTTASKIQRFMEGKYDAA
jgi:hypothetical protein